MDQALTTEFRWDPYVLMRNQQIEPFAAAHFAAAGKKTLFILGEGFDVRMNKGIGSLLAACPQMDADCLLIQYDEGKTSNSKKYRPQVRANVEALERMLPKQKIIPKKIALWSSEGKKKKRVGDQNASELFGDAQSFRPYTDIVVDISALPRGIYFSLIGKIQTLLDTYYADTDKNFFVLTAENASLDGYIREFEPDSELSYAFGFRGGSELTSEKKQTIWLPVLGEGNSRQIMAAYEKIKPDEICPVLPFPSRDPRRSDALLIEYYPVLFDGLNIEGQHIIYVPEQNPFEVYRTLSQTIHDYYDTLSVMKGCDIVISSFSSKLLSIGALLCAYEFKSMGMVKVGILNVDSSGYEILQPGLDQNVADASELFLIWLSGEPYKK